MLVCLSLSLSLSLSLCKRQPQFTSLQREDGETIKLTMQAKKDLAAARPKPQVQLTVDSSVPAHALELFK